MDREPTAHASDELGDETLVATGGVRHAESESELARGSTVGRYVVLSKIGAGGMGVVYAAYDPELDRKIALKLMRPGGRREADSSGRARLMREAQAMAKVAHPNVVAVHDVGSWEEQVFIAMEFVEGRTLTEWMSVSHSLPEIVDVFAQAGRGLAAAHAKGLIHRDFKPDNALVGSDGRVRVMDFGLARPENGEEEDVRGDTKEVPNVDALATPLTQEGAVVGTPAYMSPEQHRGEPTDARTDQFSFCVALYEAAYRERPFPAKSYVALAYAVINGKIRAAPAGAGVPGWLRRLLERGLSPEPSARYPDMGVLLEELEAGTRKSKRGPWAAAMGVAVLAVGGMGLSFSAGSDEDQARCTGAADLLAGVWNPKRREAVEAAFAGVEAAYASDSAQTTLASIDAWAQAWTAAHTDACRATRVRAEQSEAVMDDRMRCLSGRKRELEAAISVLANADAAVVKRAAQVVDGIGDVDRCADLEYLAAEIPPPDDASVAREVEQAEASLAQARALLRAGKFEPALEVTEGALEQANALEYTPLVAQARYGRGLVFQDMHRGEEAEADLREAFLLAERAGDEATALRAAAKLGRVAGYLRNHHEEGLLWSDIALAKLVRNPEVEPEADVLNDRAAILLDDNDFDGAIALLRRAIELHEEEGEGESIDLGHYYNNLAAALVRTGKAEEAARYQDRALALWERLLGPRHPDTANALINATVIATQLEDHDRAIQMGERALEIWRQNGETEQPNQGIAELSVGNAHVSRHDYAVGREHLEAGIGILERTLGPDHPNLGIALDNLAHLEAEQEQWKAALEHLQRSLKIWEGAYGPDHPELCQTLGAISRAYRGMDRPGEAVAWAERSLKVRESAGGTGDPLLLPQAQLELARALHEAGRGRARAIELGRASVEGFRAAGERGKRFAADAEKWLALVE